MRAQYPGANPKVIAETVATPIELEVNGVDDMLYISSQSTGDGRLSINVVFEPGVDIDQAQVNVQNRVAVAQPRLPEDVQRLGRIIVFAGEQAKFKAGDLVREISSKLGGSGGGDARFGQGGGKDTAKLADAISHAESVIRKTVNL